MKVILCGKRKTFYEEKRITNYSRIINQENKKATESCKKSASKVEYKPLKGIQISCNLHDRKVQKVKAKTRGK